MCRRTTCSKCGKPSFAGCGAHVEQVLGDVPREQRCKCHETTAAEKRSASSAGAKTDDKGAARKWWPF